MDLRNIPAPSHRAAWPKYLDAVDALARKPEVTIDEIVLGGQLFNRLRPVLDSWSHELQRHAQDRLRGLASAKSDSELKQLHSALGAVIGRLRDFAAITNSGNAEFPVTINHEKFAVAVLAADTQARAKAAEETAKPANPLRWTPTGWIKR